VGSLLPVLRLQEGRGVITDTEEKERKVGGGFAEFAFVIFSLLLGFVWISWLSLKEQTAEQYENSW